VTLYKVPHITLYDIGRQRWIDEMEAEKNRRTAVLIRRLADALGWSTRV
jgi:hypothetical protein